LSDWSLAAVDEAHAYGFADPLLMIEIRGQLPNPGYELRIERSLLTVEPPGFEAQWRQRPGAWPEVLVPYEYRAWFELGPRPEVVLHQAGGALQLLVEEPVEVPVEGLVGPSAELRSSNLRDPLTGVALGPAEAVGYSSAYDFGEALRAAIASLPAPNSMYPDELFRYEVLASGAEIGGFAGFDQLWVKVRGARGA
jgi:hypothetical protein